MIIVDKISLKKNNETLLNSITCNFSDGRINTLIGKSGAGKTTLLKTLVGLIKPQEGKITIDNKEVSLMTPSERIQEIGYVFQDFCLFPNLTVLENCIDPQLLRNISYSDAKSSARTILQSLNMEDFTNKYPSELSGGQQQRVAIARALCLSPKVLVLDEPTASLDPYNTDILIAILERLKKQGLTIIISSQDMNFVRRIFDMVYYIDSGKLVETCEDVSMINKCPSISTFIKESSIKNS